MCAKIWHEDIKCTDKLLYICLRSSVENAHWRKCVCEREKGREKDKQGVFVLGTKNLSEVHTYRLHFGGGGGSWVILTLPVFIVGTQLIHQHWNRTEIWGEDTRRELAAMVTVNSSGINILMLWKWKGWQLPGSLGLAWAASTVVSFPDPQYSTHTRTLPFSLHTVGLAWGSRTTSALPLS